MHGWEDDDNDDYEALNKKLMGDAGIGRKKPGLDKKVKTSYMDARRAERVPSEERQSDEMSRKSDDQRSGG